MKTLVAGFGNLFLGDDGFGVEVLRRFVARGVPEGVEAVEVGIGGLDLVLRLMDGFDRVIIVDLVRRGAAPGTVIAFTPDETETTLQAGERVDPHLAEPSRALKLARHFGALPGSVTIIGCEPLSLDVGIGLSSQVSSGVERALETIDSVLSPPLDAPERASTLRGAAPGN